MFELYAAHWMRNPASGEIARLNALDEDGRHLDVDLWLQPGAAVARAHVHDRFVERFEVRSGEVGFQIGDRERVVGPDDGVREVPAGTGHDWWNAGTGAAHVRVEIEAVPSATGRPAERFVAMIEAVWSLGALGRVNAGGVPDMLWLAAIAREYRDAIRFVRPPGTVLAAVAAIARLRGRDPLAAELHGPSAACALSDPGEEGLAAMLAEPVAARAARGRDDGDRARR